MLPNGPHVTLCALLVKECFTADSSMFCSPVVKVDIAIVVNKNLVEIGVPN